MKFSEQTSVYIAEYMKIALEHSKKYYNEKRKSEDSENETTPEIKNIKEEQKSPIKHEEESEPIKLTDTHNTHVKKPAEEINLSTHSDSKTTHSRRRNSIANSNLESPTHDAPASLKHKSLKRVHDPQTYVSKKKKYLRVYQLRLIMSTELMTCFVCRVMFVHLKHQIIIAYKMNFPCTCLIPKEMIKL